MNAHQRRVARPRWERFLPHLLTAARELEAAAMEAIARHAPVFDNLYRRGA